MKRVLDSKNAALCEKHRLNSTEEKERPGNEIRCSIEQKRHFARKSGVVESDACFILSQMILNFLPSTRGRVYHDCIFHSPASQPHDPDAARVTAPASEPRMLLPSERHSNVNDNGSNSLAECETR